MPKAMFAFSADPITYGHINVIERAARFFDELVVGVGNNQSKLATYTFSLNERTEMARRSLQHIPNVKVVSYDCLLVDYAYEYGIPTIVKGLRDIRDLDYEKSIKEIGKLHQAGIETFFLTCEDNTSYISSSAVKEIQSEHGATEQFVPLYVKQCLEATISGIYVVGLTGPIAVGKNTITDSLIKEGAKHGIQVNNMDLDNITHEIQSTRIEPGYQIVRDQIIAEFGPEVAYPDGTINRKALGPKAFSSKERLKALNEIMSNPILTRTRIERRKMKQIIIVNAALLIETNMTYLCNNNLILVNANKESQRRRLIARGHNPDEIKRRVESQLTYEAKLAGIEHRIKEDRQGHVWQVENSDGVAPDTPGLFKSICDELKVK